MLTVTQMLRKNGVVGKFVEFFGAGLDNLPLEDRATIANMAPEYGATCGFFPVDDETLDYLDGTGRRPERVALVEAYAKAQGLWREADTPDPVFTDTLELDLGDGRAVARRAEAAAGPRAARPRRPPPSPRRSTRNTARRDEARQARAGRGHQLRPRPRRRGDRRHHLLHQHLQPVRDDRRRPARQERGEARA